jgi:catechol 2,3-dioxygenase-like lactoylglutathione lyase family enzyme
MSYVALVTERFDQLAEFYGEQLGFPVVDAWDRPGARGVRFDTGGMRLEIIDNLRERQPRPLGDPADRLHLVVEVVDIEAARDRLAMDTPAVIETAWGARLFRVRDPDDIPVTFLEWTKKQGETP